MWVGLPDSNHHHHYHHHSHHIIIINYYQYSNDVDCLMLISSVILGQHCNILLLIQIMILMSCRSGLISVLKVLKLLLLASAYASIFQVMLEVKLEGGKAVSEERQHTAKSLQAVLDQIIPSSEHKLKNVSMNLAKLYTDKVMVP